MRGRKPKQESRGIVIRARLAEWKQAPEPSRPSLRELARELGTSHQLLGHYLKRLGEWEGEQCLREAREIRARAAAENRFLTPWEEQQAHARDRAGVHAIVDSMLLDDIMRMKEESERGPLRQSEIKLLKFFAEKDIPGAQELLQKCLLQGVKTRKPFAEIVKETPRQEGETYVAWVRRIWDQCEKYDTKCPTLITEELLEKCSQGSKKSRRNNLPRIPAGAARSFK